MLTVLNLRMEARIQSSLLICAATWLGLGLGIGVGVGLGVGLGLGVG